MKAKQLIKKLRKNGVQIIKGRGKGGHYLAKSKNGRATIPVHGDQDFGSTFIKMLYKQPGIDPGQL